MAFCGNYRDMKKTRPSGASELTDKNLMRAVTTHTKETFWEAYRHTPDRYAYVRRWGTVLRREARRRGLL